MPRSNSRSRQTFSRRSILLAGLGTVVATTLGACGDGEDAPLVVTPARDTLLPDVVPTQLSIANTNVMSDAPLMVALERGLFSAETIEPDLQLRIEDVELIELLTTGATEIAIAPLGPAFFNALQAGHELRIAGPLATDIEPLSMPLMVSRERFEAGEIGAVADLAGTTIGMARQGFPEYLLARVLEAGGLALDDVEIEFTSDRRLRTRLERGLIGAALLAEPEATAAAEAGQAVALSEDYLPGYTASYALTTASFLESDSDTVNRFFRVLYNACAEMVADGYNSARNQNIFQLYTGADRSTLAAMRPYGCPTDGTVDADEIAAIQRFYLDRGMLNLTTAVDPAGIIDDRLAHAAAESIFTA